MRRNDLNTEELRFERLLQSLDRAPAAPDPEFLRQLKEASTAAFLASRPARPRAERAANVSPSNPAVSRRRLLRLRVAMFSSVAALLLIGMLSPVLFPSRGVELRVALDNLTRSSSYEIEIQNGAGSNTLLFARRDDASAYWRVDYPSGNAEVSDGTATYFLNRGRNSLHPSAPEEASITPTFVEDKLLAGLNVNDPAEQSSLLKQRPEAIVNQNGQQVLVYNFSTPDPGHEGQTLTVNALVNAENKTLVAMNSELKDAAGNSKLRANIDVKSINSAIPIERFEVDPQAEINEQIAMVEDVQGLAVVDDRTPLDGIVDARNGFDSQPEIYSRAARSSDDFGGPLPRGLTAVQGDQTKSAAASGLAVADDIADEKKREQFKLGTTVASKPQAKMLANAAAPAPAVASEPITASEAASAKGNAEDKPADRDSNSRRLAGMRGQRMMKGFAAPGGMGGGGPRPLAAESVDKLAENRSQPALVAKGAMQARGGLQAAAAPAAAQKFGATNAPSPSAAEESANRDFASAEKSVARKIESQNGRPSAGIAQLKVAGAEMKSDMQRAAKDGASARKANLSNAGVAGEKEALSAAEPQAGVLQKPGQAPQRQLVDSQLSERAEIVNEVPMAGAPDNNALQSMRMNNVFNPSQSVLNDRGGDYGYGIVRRQVTPQTELLPGGVLKTEPDPANVVWVRLANNADLVVGPGSEVLLLKPTEVRLQAGELMLNVPAGDQVDLLGPEPLSRVDAATGYRSVRRNQQQAKFPASRQLVTGRGLFRIENSQLQRVDQEPEWLANYFSRQNVNGPQSRGTRRKAIQSLGDQLDRKGKNAPEAKPAAQGPE